MISNNKIGAQAFLATAVGRSMITDRTVLIVITAAPINPKIARIDGIALLL